MAASEHVQKALHTCSDHEHMEKEMYCRKCKKPVCTKCVKGEHRDHDWDTMACIVKELRRQTSQEKMLLESVSKSILVGTEEFLNTLALATDHELEENCSALESKRKGIVDFVNKSFDDMKSQCKANHKSKMEPIKERINQLEMKRKRITFLIQNMDTGASDYTDSNLIDLHDEIHIILNELPALSELPQGQRDEIIYSPTTSDITTIVPLLGTLELRKSAPEAIFEHEFQVSDTYLNTIHLVSENEAWIHPTQTKRNNLIDSSGTIKQTVDLGCRVYNFTVSEDGSMYFCDFDTTTVKQIDKEGNIKSLFSTAQLIPLFINLTRSGDLLIALVDEKSYDRNSSSRRLVRRASMSGEVIMEYEYDNDGTTPLFCKPVIPVEHLNGNICVINEYRDNSDNIHSILYYLHHNGKVIFKYGGAETGFKPMDICCDNEGNILISDLYQKVHIIDSRGNFLQFLLTENSFDEKLCAIDLCGSKLWIGSRDSGLVKVFKLKCGLRK